LTFCFEFYPTVISSQHVSCNNFQHSFQGLFNNAATAIHRIRAQKKTTRTHKKIHQISIFIYHTEKGFYLFFCSSWIGIGWNRMSMTWFLKNALPYTGKKIAIGRFGEVGYMLKKNRNLGKIGAFPKKSFTTFFFELSSLSIFSPCSSFSPFIYNHLSVFIFLIDDLLKSSSKYFIYY